MVQQQREVSPCLQKNGELKVLLSLLGFCWLMLKNVAIQKVQ